MFSYIEAKPAELRNSFNNMGSSSDKKQIFKHIESEPTIIDALKGMLLFF